MAMSYGLPTTSATTSSNSTTTLASQQSQYGASGSDAAAATGRRLTLNPEAPTFIPGRRLHQGVQERSNILSTLSDRQASEYQGVTPRTFHPGTKSSSPEAIEEEVSDAFAILNNKNFTEAEKAFRIILHKNQGILSSFDKQNITIGLARSLKEQTFEKQIEACSILEELRLDGTFTSFGASTTYHLDLTLSLCEEALGRHFDAELRLLRLREKRCNANEEVLCKPSRHYAADITNARLWQSMGKHRLAEALLMNIQAELINELQSKPYIPDTSKLRKYLDTVNVALGRIWQLMDKHHQSEELLLKTSHKRPDDPEEILCKPTGQRSIDLALVRIWETMDKNELAEKLLLNISGKNPNDNEETLCGSCGDHDLDLTLARLWQIIGRHKRAERLLLNMSGKHPGANRETLCKPCGNGQTDLALVRYWEQIGKNKLAEKLLLNMSGKHPDAREEILCVPCWRHVIDLSLVRHWQNTGKYKRAEKLLLNMIGTHPSDIEEILYGPSGNYDIDMARARLWQVMGKPEQTERLLLNICNKSLNDSEESLCRPCGHHDIDLALVCSWEMIGRNKWAQRLLRRCRDLYQTNECEYMLLTLSSGWPEFMEMISHYPESANTLLATSIHYFKLACEQIIKEGPEAGNDNLNKSLEILESLLEKYPSNAAAYSQKAHCLRMQGRSEQEWLECFGRAEAIDPARVYKVKSHFWRSNESTALQKVLASQVR